MTCVHLWGLHHRNGKFSVLHSQLLCPVDTLSLHRSVAHISMENFPPGLTFHNSHSSGPSLQPQFLSCYRRLQQRRDTQQFKAVLLSLKRLGPHMKTSNSLRALQLNRPHSQSRPRLRVLEYEQSGGVKELRRKTREMMRIRAQSASFTQQRPASALIISESTSLSGKCAILSLRSNHSSYLRARLTPARAKLPLHQPSSASSQHLSPRQHFRKVVAAAAASFSTEEVSGWA